MGYSAWKIWLHPRTARDVMEELEGKVGEIEKIRDEILAYEACKSDKEKEIERLLAENDKLSESTRVLASKIVEQEHDLQTARRELEHNRKELESRKDVENRIAEFEKMLQQVEQMKSKYEQRIYKLREAVKELKSQQHKASQSKSLNTELNVIDMTMPQSHTKTAPDEPDWLEELPT